MRQKPPFPDSSSHNTPAHSHLFRALEAGASIEHIGALIASGEDPNQKDALGRTAMDIAVTNKNWELADLLLKTGAKPPSYDGNPDDPLKNVGTDTALTFLIKTANDYAPVFPVLANGADVNLPNKHGKTPLYVAVHERPWSHVVLMLLKRGAWIDPAKPDPDEIVDTTTGGTRLLAAILYGDDEALVKKTLESGANPDKADHQGLTPLALARALGWSSVETLLLKHGARPDVSFPDPNQKIGKNKDTPLLHYAMSHQSCDTKYKLALLKAGAAPNITGPDGKTPLHWAAAYNNVDVIDALVEAGADISAPDTGNGLTPLHVACQKNKFEAAQRLLEICSNEAINQPAGKQDDTPLHLAAAQKDSDDIVRMLIFYGAFVNARNKNNETPLNIATDRLDPETVRILLENGADVSAGSDDKTNYFLLSDAVLTRDKNGPAIVKLLLDAGINPDITFPGGGGTPSEGGLLYYIMENRADDTVVRMLLDAGANPHATGPTGESVMHMCLRLRKKEGVRLLLEHGFDPLKIYHYKSPWHGTSFDVAQQTKGSAYDYIKILSAKFKGAVKDFDEMLALIEEHLATKKEVKTAPAPKPSP